MSKSIIKIGDGKKRRTSRKKELKITSRIIRNGGRKTPMKDKEFDDKRMMFVILLDTGVFMRLQEHCRNGAISTYRFIEAAIAEKLEEEKKEGDKNDN